MPLLSKAVAQSARMPILLGQMVANPLPTRCSEQCLPWGLHPRLPPRTAPPFRSGPSIRARKGAPHGPTFYSNESHGRVLPSKGGRIRHPLPCVARFPTAFLFVQNPLQAADLHGRLEGITSPSWRALRPEKATQCGIVPKVIGALSPEKAAFQGRPAPGSLRNPMPHGSSDPKAPGIFSR